MKSASHTTLWIGAALGALALAGASVAQPPPNWDALRRTISERHPQVPWVQASLLERWLDGEPRPLLLDSRAPAEFRASHLEGARRIDPDRPDLAPLRAHRARRTVVYCSVGWRSGDIAATLLRDGWREVYNLEGGLFAWANADRPLVGPRAPAVHPFDVRWGRLLRPELRAPLRD